MHSPTLLDIPSELHTPRLLLRHPRPGDGPALYQALSTSLPELRRFLASLPWVAADPSPASCEAWCRNAAGNALTRADLPWLLWDRPGRQVLGATGLHRLVWETPKAEVGYWCRTSASGQGLVSEAVTAVSQMAFERLSLARLELICDAENHASRRVAERCGFTLEGVLHQERRAPDGSLRNTCVYARLGPPDSALGAG